MRAVEDGLIAFSALDELPGTSGALTSDWGPAAPAPRCTITGTERGDRGSGNGTSYGDDGYDAISGGAGDDTLTGSTGRDALVGGTGADMMAGGDDADVLIGIDEVRGNDSLDGGAARDVCAADPGDPVTSC